MIKSTLILFLTFVSSAVFAQFNADDLYVVSQGVGKPLTYKHLQLFPVYASGTFQDANQHLGSYVSLQNALKNEQVHISEIEVKSSQQIYDPFSNTMLVSQEITSYKEDLSINPIKSQKVGNSEEELSQDAAFSIFDNQILHPDVRNAANSLTSKLFITNHSQDTIFVMAGEVLKGGLQDRVIAKDMIVPPSENRMELPVFCAEKDRWYYRSKSSKDFDQYFAVSSLKVRKAVSELNDQGAVWTAIEDLQQTHKITSQTKAYADLMASIGFNEEQEEYLNYFTQILEDKMTVTTGHENDREKIVGVVVAMNGNIVGCDIFATHDLFIQQYESLLHSYTTEAITYGLKEGANTELKVLGMNETELNDYLKKTLESSKKNKRRIVTNENALIAESQNSTLQKVHTSTDNEVLTPEVNFEQKVHFSSFE